MPKSETLTPSLVPYLKQENGKPYLAGSRCIACGHIFVGDRTVCAKCTKRGQMEPVRLSETGKVYVFTIVHRSFPDAQTPFIDVIVDLDDGAHIKGTLIGLEPDPEHVPFGLCVKIVYRQAVPIGGDGKPYFTYAFAPMGTVEGAEK